MTKARDLANIISGGFDATDIPNLDTAKITSGTFADARLPATALNSNVDLTTLSASNLTSGTVPTARLGSGTADATTFLRGDGSFATPVGGTNTPSFVAYRTGSAQSLSNETTTRCQYNTELFDTNNCYDNSTNYRFTPTVAGKYFVYHEASFGRSASNVFYYGQVFIYKNGSNIASQQVSKNAYSNFETHNVSTICEMNGTSDYLEAYIGIGVNSGNRLLNPDLNTNQFGAYRIIE